MHNRIKIYIKITTAPTCFCVITIIRECTLPDDGDSGMHGDGDGGMHGTNVKIVYIVPHVLYFCCKAFVI